MSIAVITSLYGDLDGLCAPPVMNGVDDYIAVTEMDRGPSIWRQIIEPRRHISNRLASKIPKCLPHLYTNADVVVWVDASATVRSDTAEWTVGQMGDADVAQFAHPERDDITDEANVSMGMAKYKGLMCHEQAASYKAAGLPDNWGLWATGIMARRRSAWSEEFGERWLAEQVRWSYQDQISEPYVLWQMGVRPAELDGRLWHSEFVHFGGHRTED